MLVTRQLKINLQYWLNRERGQRDERKDRGYSIKGFNGGNKEKEWSVVPKTPKKAKWGLKSLSMSYSYRARDPVKIYSSWFWGWKTKAQWLPSASTTPKLLGLELKTFREYPDSCQLDVSSYECEHSSLRYTKLLYVLSPYFVQGPFWFSLPSKRIKDLYPWSGVAG